MTSIRRLVRKNRGMEALQAVLLLGAAFFVITALRELGTSFKKTANTEGNKSLKTTGAE